jgi:transposase
MQEQRNELNFKGQNIYAGIDVHLRSWTVCIMTEKLEHKRFTRPPEAKALYGYLSRNFPGAGYHSVYETGFSGYVTHRQLEALGINSIITHAADVPTGEKERLQKDDGVDSRKLARSLRSGDLEAICVPSASTVEDRSPVRMRGTMVKDMARMKQRIKSFLYFFGVSCPERFSRSGNHRSKNFMKWLKEEVQLSEESGRQSPGVLVREVEEQRKLMLLVSGQTREPGKKGKYAGNVRLLLTVPGTGLLAAMRFLTEIENINRFENTDHFAAYPGPVPNRHNSGEVKNDGEMTRRGQSMLRKSIIEPAWTAARHDPALSLAYNRYVRRMNPNRAIIRIARKLLNRIYFVLKNKKEYVTCVSK